MMQDKKKKPRIALMSYAMDNRPGMGTALYTRRLIEQLLLSDEFELYLVHFEHVDDPLYEKAHEILMPYIKLPVATRFVRTMLFFWKSRNEKFDIIHWFQARLYPFFWLAPAKHIVITAHGAGDVSLKTPLIFSTWVFIKMMQYFHRYIAAVIAVSEFGKREIEEWYGIPADKVFVTYPGGGERFTCIPREQARATIKDRYGIMEPYILDVSRLEPHKNVARLVEAYLRARERGVTQKLVLVGKDSGEGRIVRALAAASPYGGDIVHIPYADGAELNALYVAADIFVFPSLNEGFGSPLAEAMSMGIPIITSNMTAPPEVAAGSALFVDPYDIEELASAITRLLSDEKLRKELGENGLKRSRMFRWAETARETVRLYEEILRKPR